ncbi:NADH-quinone oxidoreductase subunit L [Brucella melitensis]|uniref:NADH-ubiquinone oxidoreductase chain 5 n=1 Tax=Brucella melitensis biotype 1 (strain ATCC 23456 / CCUG 17765 / NCTC 10094 / 16M) TaxID=224914 RepID=Q8YGL1_BRUME|nr:MULTISPECIES: NADH-quinone oxidoreductase subunit L [Brucella]EPZ75763.1 NADH:ubiquinone oxidoreductase subunit L [Brucella melitensis ADMAS-G1]AAL52328.1 NADH-quinone oxidoreductase chain l [Brucella melitensis bv. 1 str. 16M]AIJ90301.1 proton-translocating NADH-quinone oxidoreductase, chain L family protein [Brucella melitensis bv. 1 str. 16M]ARY43401.1 NADH-quinone oxidoreductase subunit L [Brucella melitensis]ARY46558.1 NADH-quinone oxidoreductase subunit L [Brucella melitensis]
MLYYAIVFLPLIGFLVAGLFGNKIGAKASEYITSGLMVFVAILSWIVFFKIPLGHDAETVRIPVLHWVNSGALTFDWALRVDTLTGVMLVVVNSVSALVHIYSIGYMHHDPHRPRFFAYLSLFTFAMLMLVTSDNLIQMFFGWEGVGLASYLLIGFWFKKPSANAAAMKAFVVNRVGDFGFLLGIFSVFALFQSVDYNTIFAAAANALPGGDANQVVLDFLGYQLDRQGAITIACLLLFMGAMGKSAQFLLHTWLPDAMEGPTPVSALIHAATMVTAGVFMVARMSPIFELSQTALLVVTIIGATTAFFAATVALVQNDIKRVIAYSTCSQLGYMFAALGVGAYGAAVFHLFTHAFFKALLFLCAGSVIHAVSDEQDMRRMGGLRKLIPVTYWMMIIGTVAITGLGIPGTVIGTAGFFSKDGIIEAVFASHNLASGYASTLLIVAALFTSFYSWRLIFMTFFGKPRASAEVMHHVHESPPVMLVPLLILGIGAILAGVLFKELFFGHEYVEFWKGSLFTSTANQLLEEHHHVPLWVKLSPFVAMVIGFVVAWIFYIRAPEMPKALAARHRGLYQFLLNKWYFDELYDFLFVRPARWLGRLFWKGGDGWLIDGFGPNGVSARVLDVTNRVVKMQSGYLYHYAFAMLIGVAALVTWMMLGSSF